MPEDLMLYQHSRGNLKFRVINYTRLKAKAGSYMNVRKVR